MDSRKFLISVIRPALRTMSAISHPPGVELLLLATALQESALQYRYQLTRSGAPGPARGMYQFEEPTVALVMKHPTAGGIFKPLCSLMSVDYDSRSVWRAIEGNDLLATWLARLDYFCNSKPIPPDNEEAMWQYYNTTWNPGKPDRSRWTKSYAAAKLAIAEVDDA